MPRKNPANSRQEMALMARDATTISFRGSEIDFFLDISTEISRKKAAFASVKPQHKNASFNYRMLFPTKLQVTDKKGQKQTFLSP